MRKIPLLNLKELNLDIFNYKEALDFLKDYFNKSKAMNRKLSNRYCSTILTDGEFPTYVSKILRGERLINEQFLYDFIEKTQMDMESARYFELLVRIARLKDNSKKRKEFEKELRELRMAKELTYTMDHLTAASICSWLHLVVREIALLSDSVDLRTIQKSLLPFVLAGEKDGKRMILGCIADLIKVGILIEKEDGAIEPQDKHITFKDRDDIISKIIKEAHFEVLRQAIKALEEPRVRKDERDYYSVVIATTPEQCVAFQKWLKEAHKKAKKILDAPNGEATLLVNFASQFFPVTTSIENNNEVPKKL
ncbi:MAG: TIGR02147 family protein [SAR324 cluster bacterium]|nr:TIGR02147 family protein [SAR324 cluster bacterium]